MDVAGRVVVSGTAEAVFDAICDPAVLLEVIPGCESVERLEDGEYRATLALRMPGLAGRYEASVRLVHAERPSLGELEGRVDGRTGSVTGRASFRLATAEPGRTTVEYRATAIVAGPLARLDGRFVDGLVGTLVGQGLEHLGRRVVAAPGQPDGDIVGASR